MSTRQRVRNVAKQTWRRASRGLLAPVTNPKLLDAASSVLQQAQHEVDGRRRQVVARHDPLVRPAVCDWTGTDQLRRSVLEPSAPWLEIGLDGVACSSPSMIGQEEKQYYVYLGRYFRGEGAVVELGPWLGASTAHIVAGLDGNPKFDGSRVQVFDDFVWRSSWMDQHLPADVPPPNDGEDFRPLFERFAQPYLDQLDVFARRIGEDDGHGLEPFSWDGGPIEIAFVDCGRTFEVNEAWYSVLAPHFVPDRTLVVMQDWHTHRQVPARWYNQIKQFTDSHGDALDLVHEVTVGGVATFLYRG